MMPFAPICYDCSRLIAESRTDAGPLRCTAFPLGVPAEILQSTADHRQEFDGDHGMRYVPRNASAPNAISHNPLLNAEPIAKEFDESKHPRGEHGRFTSGGEGTHEDGTPLDGRDIEHALQTDSVDEAARALSEGKYVNLTQAVGPSTILDKLAALGKEAQAAGGKAPAIDLAHVTVKGSNLFMNGNLGVPRIEMPQFILKASDVQAGSPLAHMLADGTIKPDAKGEVNLTPLFAAHLENMGITSEATTRPADFLRATQREIDGVKVGGMMGAMASGVLDRSKMGPVLTTRDDYVLDGHHQWAATVGLEHKIGSTDKLEVRAFRFDAAITTVLREAQSWTVAMGSLPRAFGKRKLIVEKAEGWDEDKHPRDDHGKFAPGATVSEIQRELAQQVRDIKARQRAVAQDEREARALRVQATNRGWASHSPTIAGTIDDGTRQLVWSAAILSGIDPASITLQEGAGKTFKVGNAEFTEGGHYDPAYGHITLFVPNALTEDAVAHIVAHEATHLKVDAVMGENQKEEAAYKPHMSDTSEYVDGRLKEPFATQFPVLAAMRELEARNWGKSGYETLTGALMKEDGVTQYSASYWQALDKYPRTSVVLNAVNETLAELASERAADRLVRGSLIGGKGAFDRLLADRPAFKALYAMVDEQYSTGLYKPKGSIGGGL
jgi:hypothetical protein